MNKQPVDIIKELNIFLSTLTENISVDKLNRLSQLFINSILNRNDLVFKYSDTELPTIGITNKRNSIVDECQFRYPKPSEKETSKQECRLGSINESIGIFSTKNVAISQSDEQVLQLFSSIILPFFKRKTEPGNKIASDSNTAGFDDLSAENPNPVLQVNNKCELLYANKASEPLLKYQEFSVGQKVCLPFLEAISQLSEWNTQIEKEITLGKQTYAFQFVKVSKSDSYTIYGRDITARKNLEAELRKMALIAKETENAVIVTNKKGEIEWVNQAFEATTGYTIDEVRGKIPGKILQGEDTDPQSVRNIAQALKKKIPIEIDLINYSKSNRKYWVKLQIQPVFNTEGEIENFISIQKEITSDKQIELELLRTTQFQQAILNSSAIAIISTDLDGVIRSFNPAASRMLGYSPEEVIGIHTAHLYHDEAEIRTHVKAPDNVQFNELAIFDIPEVIETNEELPQSGEFTFVRKDGNKFPVSQTVTALRGSGNRINGFLAMAEDITQRNKQYEAFRTANLRFKMLISSLQAGIMVEDENRQVVLVNQHFCDLFSIPLPPDALVGSSCVQAAEVSKNLFTNPDAFITDIENTLAIRNVVTNFELHTVSGKTMERDFIPIGETENTNQGILWIYRDITLRKKNDNELLRQSEILSGTARAMNHLLTLPDHSEAINKALEAIGKATGVDRVYIFENVPDQETKEAIFSQRYEWTAEGVAPQIDNEDLQNIPFSEGFPRWYDLLMKGKPVTGLVKDFPQSERQILEVQDIISIIVVPIFVNNNLWGMVGFDDCSKGYQWTKNETSILIALAASLGGSFSKRMVENQLIEARQIAEHATRSKSEFLATMSHEIRTPMNGVIGMTSLLLQTQLTPEQRGFSETIKTSGELLLDLINDILDFSKIESGKMVLEETDFNLTMAIEDVMELMATTAFRKKLGLHFIIDPEIGNRIIGDLTRLRQILVNLTSNAIKFTHSGEITIHIRQLETKGTNIILEFSVKDTGIGIPPEKIDRLFKPFSQVDASTTRKYGGTGLGLAICAKLVKLMNGEISVKSELNHGSEFVFTIRTAYKTEKTSEKKHFDESELAGKTVLCIVPGQTQQKILKSIFETEGIKFVMVETLKMALKPSVTKLKPDFIFIDEDSFEPAVASDEHIEKLSKGIIPVIQLGDPNTVVADSKTAFPNIKLNKPLKHSQLLASLKRLVSNPAYTGKPGTSEPKDQLKISDHYPLNILVAEDNAINQKLILSLFEMLGYTIHIAANGLEVLDALKMLTVDIIFMDIQMPEMDGLEATVAINRLYGENKPLIVAMTANALISDREKCLDAGMDDYISKPLTIEQVRNSMPKWAAMCLAPKTVKIKQ